MAQEEKTEKIETEIKLPERKGVNKKVLLFGLPLFVVQLIVVYFITANILLNKVQNHTTIANGDVTSAEAVNDSSLIDSTLYGKVELGKYIYSIDDIIVNPAGTDGKRLFLLSIAFDLAKEANKTEMKDKEVLVKDIVISTLASKSITQIGNISYRDSLRTEITDHVLKMIPDLKINKVYFSKYIIQ